MKLKAASCGVTSAVAPLEYLIYVVEPNLAALAAEYGDIRHNLNFVHSLDALAAHVYYASNGAAPGRDDLEYRSELAKQHSEFALLRDIATRYFLIHRFIAASDPCGLARRK